MLQATTTGQLPLITILVIKLIFLDTVRVCIYIDLILTVYRNLYAWD